MTGLESRNQTVLQSRLDRTIKSYFGLVSKFRTGMLTNQSDPVQSNQSNGEELVEEQKAKVHHNGDK